MRIPVRYIIRRLGFLLAVMWTAATINFLLPHLTPRDPIQEQVTQKVALMGIDSQSAADMIAELKTLYGLDRPLWEQYLRYLWNTLRFDLGRSIQEYPRTVMDIIGQTIGWTLGFVGTATIIAFLLGTILGALVGWSKSPRWLGGLIPPLALFSAIPGFVLGLVFIYYFAFRLRMFPLMRGFSATIVKDWSDINFWLDVAWHAVLPAASLLLTTMGGWALGMRAMMVTVEGSDYITFAEAKGLKGSRIFFRYALRNCLLPQVTALAMTLGAIVSGSALVENIFAYPGVGARLGAAITAFDYYVLYGIVFFLVMGIAVATFAVDLIYPLLDPRISYQEG